MSIVNAKSRCSFFVAIIHFGFRSLQTSMLIRMFSYFSKNLPSFAIPFWLNFVCFALFLHAKSTYQINACIFVSHSLKTDYTVSFTIFYIVLFDCVNIKWWKQIFFFSMEWKLILIWRQVNKLTVLWMFGTLKSN